MGTVELIYTIITTTLAVLCYYRDFYTIFGFIMPKKKYPEAKNFHKFGIIISARNECRVIGKLVESLKKQDYPSDLITVFVIADNCTDNTAEVARNAGAVVYERFDNINIGKGHALSWFHKILFSEYVDEKGDSIFDAFMIFDADNLVSKNYVHEMNKVLDAGYKVCRGYFNTKNFNDNWFSASYGIHFYRSNMQLHRSRNWLGLSTTINGPGYYFTSDLIKDGWPTSTITEDIDLSMTFVKRGIRIAFCEDAEFYDEQPTKIRQGLRQRLRWAKGYLQNFKKHFLGLVGGMFNYKKGFANCVSCYDMAMQVFPRGLVNFLLRYAFRFLLILGVVIGFVENTILALLISWGLSILQSWGTTILSAFMVMIREHKHIKTSFFKAIWFAFMFPTFDRLWKWSCLIALFKKVEWKPIEHKISLDIEDVSKNKVEIINDEGKIQG